MEIKQIFQSLKKIELVLSAYEVEELRKWEGFKVDFLFALLSNRQDIVLISQNTTKKSLLRDLGETINSSWNNKKFQWLTISEVNHEQCKLIAEEAEFYLGGFFIAFLKSNGKLPEDFLKHIFPADVYFNFTDVEYIYMTNDGETIVWVNPNNSKAILEHVNNIS